MLRKILCSLLLVLTLAACDDDQQQANQLQSYSGGGMAREAKMADMAVVGAAPMAPAMAEQSAPSSMVLDRGQMGDRKIAETHNLQIETAFDVLQSRYQRDFKKCVELGCQIINSSITKEQFGNIQARIAPAKLGEFLDFLGEGEGKILNHSVSADDYTMEYSDTAAQTENLLALRERLRNLLASDKAKDVDSILRIEAELNRIQTEIDQRTSRLKILEKMTNMATVNLSYSVQYRPTELQKYELKNTWTYAVNKFLRGIDMVIQFVGATLPWVPVFFAGLWLAVRVFRFAFGKISIRMPWRKN